jgi:hypothetical protein
VAPRCQELFNGVALSLKVRLLRKQELKAARSTISPARVRWYICTFAYSNAASSLCCFELLLLFRAALPD